MIQGSASLHEHAGKQDSPEVLAAPKNFGDVALLRLADQIRQGMVHPTPRQVRELVALLDEHAQRSQAESNSAALESDPRVMLIKAVGGGFLGKEELVRARLLDREVQLPPIPDKYSVDFLASSHPLRSGPIARHTILAFDPESNEWHLLENSAAPKSFNLRGDLQDRSALKGGRPVVVNGVTLTSPDDFRPAKRIMDLLVREYVRSRDDLKDIPFARVWLRTADTARAEPGCRVIIGDAWEDGAKIETTFRSVNKDPAVGLLLHWK